MYYVRSTVIRDGKTRRIRRGLTLVELLVVIAIVAALSGVLLPAVQSAREASRRTVCINNMRQVALATLNYTGSQNGKLPAMWQGNESPPWDNFSWRTSLLPFLEQQNTYDHLQLTLSPVADQNRAGVGQPIAAFQCPSTPDAPRRIKQLRLDDQGVDNLTAASHDLAAVFSVISFHKPYPIRGIWNGGPEVKIPNLELGYSRINKGQALQRTKAGQLRFASDGLSKTALLVEQAGKPQGLGTRADADEHPPAEGAWATCDYGVFWCEGVNAHNFYDPYGFHRGAFVALCDASITLLPESTSPRILSAILSRDGSEIVSVSDWQ